MGSAQSKKRHHFVPVTYLKNFADSDGFLFVSRKDEPHTIFKAQPTETGFRNYYYSQPTPNGSMDHNALEDAFSTFENLWPEIVSTLASKSEPNRVLQGLIAMIGFQRVRVPAFRDAIEQSLAAYANAGLEEAKLSGLLPRPPSEFPNILDLVEVTIDPHQSIHGMTLLMRSVGPVLDSFGYQVLHNETEVPFISSDNPVSYFSRDDRGNINPYFVQPGRRSELIYPVTPRILIQGSLADRRRFVRKGLKNIYVRNPERVRDVNRVTARFAYEALFSGSPLPAAFVGRFRDSPVRSPSSPAFHPDQMQMPIFEFGQRRSLPKWRR